MQKLQCSGREEVFVSQDFLVLIEVVMVLIFLATRREKKRLKNSIVALLKKIKLILSM